jgi:hypothetical protein
MISIKLKYFDQVKYLIQFKYFDRAHKAVFGFEINNDSRYTKSRRTLCGRLPRRHYRFSAAFAFWLAITTSPVARSIPSAPAGGLDALVVLKYGGLLFRSDQIVLCPNLWVKSAKDEDSSGMLTLGRHPDDCY